MSVVRHRRWTDSDEACWVGDHGPVPVETIWWRTGVVYQIYRAASGTRDGDGVGDLAGMIEHLDYLDDEPSSLGMDAIWLSLIYPSAGCDSGYDVVRLRPG